MCPGLRFAAAVVAAAISFAADPLYQTAQTKVEKLVNNQWKPGEVVTLTPAEVNAWVAVAVPAAIPQGIRNIKIELGTDTASASALVDFVKIQQSRGKSVGWAMAMFQGERPLKVLVRVASGSGKMTVYLTRVELSGVGMEGSGLDFLIKNFFLPLYPDAKIGEPVDLDYNIDHLEIRPDGVKIFIKR
jgi:hypothetical protein